MPLLLILTAFIPRDAIRQHSLESAQYLYDGELFGYVREGVEGSCIDRYADAILLNIAYNLDSDHPLRSVMLSAYYFTPDHEENENYLMAVRDDPGINRQYLRYWHGSITLIRPLLTVMNVRTIYIMNAVVLVLLFAGFSYMCARMKEYALIIAYMISFVITRAWFVPLSLEYTWTFMLMLICSIIAVVLYRKKQERYYGAFFAITGMATSFLDFLTTETITLCLPLLVILWLGRGNSGERAFEKNEESTIKKPENAYTTGQKKSLRIPGWFRRNDVQTAAKCAASWLAGYAGMWSAKWFLCSIVMKENALPYVSEHVAERLSGTMGVDTEHFIIGAIIKNISCLFPLGYGTLSVIAFTAIILYAVYRGYVYRRGTNDICRILLISLIGLVPYARYIILHNHSYIHCFFTYRAQAATVAAAVLIIHYLTHDQGAAS